MAEAAGLVLGGIALFSLYSNCVEVFETLHSAKNCLQDYQSAHTKINLLKARLRHWGGLCDSESCEEERATFETYSRDEKQIISDGLTEIKRILDEISLLADKYESIVVRNQRPRLLFKPKSSTLQLPGSTVPPSSASKLPFFRKRARWAFCDKEKLGNLIQDLHFLIDSLEKAKKRFSMSSRDAANLSEDVKMEDADRPSTRGSNPKSRHEARSEQQGKRVVKWFNIDGTQRHYYPADSEPIIMGDMENKGFATGLQGPLGLKGCTVCIGGSMVNTGNSTGIQGPASAEDVIKIMRAAAENEVKRPRVDKTGKPKH